jgi:glycosyltransferase involved in cell wall biosynthesis
MSSLRGGPTFAVADMTNSLAQAGIAVHIATTNDNGLECIDVPLGQPIVQNGVTYYYFQRQTNFYLFSLPLARWLKRHVAAYDVVDIHYVFAHAGIPASRAALKHQVPYLLRPHGMLNRWSVSARRPRMKRLSMNLFERHMLAHAAAVCLTTEQERMEVAELALPFKPVVMPLGINLVPFDHLPPTGTFRQQHPHLQGKTLLLFLSRFDKKKGLDLLLPAFAQLKREQPEVALILAGSGTPAFEAKLRAEVQALGIEHDVVFTGFLSGEKKLATLADCDIFVLPSYSENFGVVVVEAMASGLPVIISNQVGLAHDIQQAEAGIVIPCQQDKLVEAIHNLVSDAAQRRQFADQARHLAQQRFSLDAATSSLIQLYTDVVTDASKQQNIKAHAVEHE